MASTRGIEATCQAVVELLRDNYDPAGFNQDLDFRVLGTGGFDTGIAAGISLYLYRILPSDVPRTPPGRPTANGGRRRSELPLDLHVILTVWSREPSLQHAIAGWMMRTLEDYPVLPPALLNRRVADVFRDDEAVEIVFGDMVNEDLLHLWELLGAGHYQLSVPYLARNIRLESERDLAVGPPVRTRVADHAVVRL